MTKEENKILVLCDFDGTTSFVDVGYKILRHFSADAWEIIDRKYRTDKMGSMEAYAMIAAAIHSSEQEFLDYLPEVTKLDRGFMAFHDYCANRGLDLKIVSDGLDFYIGHILSHYGIGHIPFFSNRLVFNNGSGIRIEFPLHNPECRRCGTCKKMLLRKFRDDYGSVIYIGDGFSDRCAAEDADFVYAKRFLYRHCEEKGIPCVLYSDFNEILAHFKDKELKFQTA